MAGKGALIGALVGYFHFVGAPTGAFELDKLMAATGNRSWSGRTLRTLRHVLTKPAAIGASVFLGYNYIVDWRRGHKDAHMRPRFYDHTFAMTMIGTIGSAFWATHPMYIFMSGLVTALVLAPSSWFLYESRLQMGRKNPFIYYENGCTQDDLDRFRHQDEIERLGFNLERS